jgi:hypothetical protein
VQEPREDDVLLLTECVRRRVMVSVLIRIRRVVTLINLKDVMRLTLLNISIKPLLLIWWILSM